MMEDGWLSGKTAAGAYASVAAVAWLRTLGAVGWLKEGMASVMSEVYEEIEDKLRAEGLDDYFKDAFAKALADTFGKRDGKRARRWA